MSRDSSKIKAVARIWMAPIWLVVSVPLRHAELVSASIMPNIQSKADRHKPLGFLTQNTDWACGAMDPETSSG
jgi:hypothetical protein